MVYHTVINTKKKNVRQGTGGLGELCSVEASGCNSSTDLNEVGERGMKVFGEKHCRQLKQHRQNPGDE